MSLIAAGRISRRWRARQTSPMPPRADLLLEDVLPELGRFGDLLAKPVGDARGDGRQRGSEDTPEDGVEGQVQLLVSWG